MYCKINTENPDPQPDLKKNVKMLDPNPYPDPYIMYMDPQHCSFSNFKIKHTT